MLCVILYDEGCKIGGVSFKCQNKSNLLRIEKIG